jgi:ethanolaminephosphotransferase
MWLATQSRVSNIPLFSIFQLQLAAFRNMKLTLMETVLTSLIFQYLSFFAFGGSNAISSVDLSNAYNGVGGYNVIGVGLLTFASNWAAPIWWASATMLLLLPNGRRTLLTYLSALSFFVGSSLVFVMVACTLLRSHLFIWTVFSPKYLYSMAWSLAQHLFVNFGFSGLLLLSGVS